MKVLVDTSAWADFLNGHPSSEAATLGELINGDDELCTCGVVVAEIFQGLRRARGRGQIGSLFRELTFLEATGIDVYLRAAEIRRTLAERGKTVRSTIDCLIAAIAEENGCTVLARDRDLHTILDSGVVRAARWTGSAS